MERNAQLIERIRFFPQKQILKFAGAILLLLFLLLIVYWPSFFNDFQHAWDDQWMLLGHPMVLDQSSENIWYYFTHYDRGQYFPLNQVYYIVIYNLFGFNPSAFHIGSFLLHFLNTILVLILLSRLSRELKMKPTLRRSFVWCVTIIFAIHPLQVESVAWISASKVLLYATFTLGSLISYLNYRMRGKITFLLVSILGYILSLMVKEQSIILPLNILLIDFLLHSFTVRKFNKRVWLDKIPYLVLGILFMLWSLQNDLGQLNPDWAYPWDQRAVFGSYSMIVYIVRFLLPTNLLFYYGFPILSGEELSWVYYSYIIVAVFFILYIVDLYRQQKLVPFFGLLFFLINILLVLHILPMPRTMITADRYMYLSTIGLAVWVWWSAYKLIQWMGKFQKWKRRSNYRLLVGGFIGLYLIGFGWYSNNLTRKWNDSVTIKRELNDFVEPSITDKKGIE